jgi:hypothetical protein
VPTGQTKAPGLGDDDGVVLGAGDVLGDGSGSSERFWFQLA